MVIAAVVAADVDADLLQCTHEPNVSVPQLAGLLLERSQNNIWVVVFKSLIGTHTLMNYGNEVSHVVCGLSTTGDCRRVTCCFGVTQSQSRDNNVMKWVCSCP